MKKNNYRGIIFPMIVFLSLTLISCPPLGPPTYTVTYNGNGSTGGSVPDNAAYQEGQPVIVPGNPGGLTNGALFFTGWNTRADGLGTTHTQGQYFTMGASDVTLYTRWSTGPVYRVIYDGNGHTGGSVPLDTTNYEGGQTVTVLGNTGSLTKSGYSFTGWNTQADGGGTTYTLGQTFSAGTSDVTLYAGWTDVFLYANTSGDAAYPGTQAKPKLTRQSAIKSAHDGE